MIDTALLYVFIGSFVWLTVYCVNGRGSFWLLLLWPAWVALYIYVATGRARS